MTSGSDVRVEVLGSVRVTNHGDEISLSPQLRRLLGILVVADGEPVSSDRLAEYIAGGRIEGSTVRTAVSRLRKVLGDRVESVGGGYRLKLAADELDLVCFGALIAGSQSSPDEARAVALSSAIELSRGPAFGDLAPEEWAAAEAARLDGLLADAIEHLAEALLSTGRANEAVETLEAHLASHPFRERPVGLAMRALTAAGRLADALRLFQRFRAVLRDETGLEPSAELRAVEADLLTMGLLAPDPDPPAFDTPGRTMPSGTLTFLFTDIEGSTERWSLDEAAMAAALAAHDQVIRSAVDRNGGVVFKHTGDGVCAVFEVARSAVEAAVVAQRSLDLPVRMGMHTGEAELRDGDYFGPTLNRVARIMDAGHGGQVLMSAATATLVDGEPTDLGQHRLKGLSSPERIFQWGTDEFAPLRVASARAGNLPTELSVFIGRSEELADLAGRVADHRLVCLIGVGGTGKTRLAVEVARALAPLFPDGCWLAELAPVSVPDAVPFSLAASLGLSVPENHDVLDHIIGRLRHQRRLVIIDNCEHVLMAAADAVERLLAACPSLTIVATSREALMVGGEQITAVGSLSGDDAVGLFHSRASYEAPEAVLDEMQLDAVDQLCERLDRLPLAIELAASRLRVMTPVEMLAGLDERFRLLTGGRRSRMERHQTMRGTLDWSYELCGDADRLLFDSVSVFATAFDLDGAAAVTADRGASKFDVIDSLGRLVEQSMIQRVTIDDGTSRFALLETMRAYGREHLADAGLADDVRARHAEYVRERIGWLSLRSFGPDEAAACAETRRLLPDVVVAIDWCIEHGFWSQAVLLTGFRDVVEDRIIKSLASRVHDAMIAAEGSLSGLGLHEQYHLLIMTVGPDDIWRAGPAEISDLGLQLLRGDDPLVTDRLLATPYGALLFFHMRHDRRHQSEIVELLERIGTAPLAVRFVAHLFAVEAMNQASMISDRPEAAPTVDAELARLVGELESERARRYEVSLRSGAATQAGAFAQALEFAEAALPRDEPHIALDLVAACRVLRALAALGRPPTGDELRRPWKWMFDGGFDKEQFIVLHSAAGAVDVAGFADLADRLLARARTIFAEKMWSEASTWLPDHLFERAMRIAPSEESIDDLAEAVFEIAEELDRSVDVSAALSGAQAAPTKGGATHPADD